MSSLHVPGTPQASSTRDELIGKCKCDEERTFLVRVRPGMTQAEVLFLNNVKGDGWEGPFQPLQVMNMVMSSMNITSDQSSKKGFVIIILVMEFLTKHS